MNNVDDVKDFNPDDIVKSCKYIEMGSCYSLDGIRCCVHGSAGSPVIISKEEFLDKKVDYELIQERRRLLFEALNGLNDMPVGDCPTCSHLKEKKYKDVNFEYLGGESLPAGFNIQHYTECNQRCLYCCYAQEGNMVKPQYDILEYFEIFNKEGKLRGNNYIDFSGGEPAMLKDFDRILTYLLDNKLGKVLVYSNALKYSQSICDALASDKITLVTSLDTGIPSTYQKLRGVGSGAFSKVFANLVKYGNVGSKNMWLKYVVTEHNRTEDDMYSFLMAMITLRPSHIMLCPDFPYGDKEIPAETVEFIAELWCLIERFMGIVPFDYTGCLGSPKFVKYHEDLANALKEYREANQTDDNLILKNHELNDGVRVKKLTFIQKIFSLKREKNHKVVRLLGLKLKFKSEKKNVK